MLKVQVPYPTSDIEAATKKYVDDKIAEALLPKDNIIYGFHINGNESDPSTAVTYLEDAVGMTPCYMNYYNGFFDYGSWEHAFFMPKPCMLKYDGTVDYYLNPNDYSLKEDGTASDIANTSYEGNAMIEWGQNGKKIWYKIVPDTLRQNSASVYIANYKADDDFECYSFIGGSNQLLDHFYTPIYNGSNISSKLRSLSGQTHMVSQSGTTEISYAQANGSGWYIEQFCDRILINLLLILMGKSLDTQKIFGNGHYTGGSSASSNLPTGLMDSKGMFWGTNGNTGVKVFGMENWWAEVWRRTAGLINDRGTYKIKMTSNTYDGSTATTYNTTGEGYISAGTVPAASGSYISNMSFVNNVLLPAIVTGSASTYYCDGMWSNNGQVDYALVGGNSYYSSLCGAFAVSLGDLVSSTAWAVGAALSYKHS